MNRIASQHLRSPPRPFSGTPVRVTIDGDDTVPLRLLRQALATGLLALALSACESNRDKIESPHVVTNLAEDTTQNVTPLADGGAYAVGLETGLWYMRGAQAAKVNLPSPAPDRFATLHVTPLMDGGAYVTSDLAKSAWYVRGSHAESVSQVAALSAAPVKTPISAFPLYVSERERRIAAEQELEQRPNPDDQPEQSDDSGYP